MMHITLFISENETPAHELNSTAFVAFYTIRCVLSSEGVWCTVVNLTISLYTELSIILYIQHVLGVCDKPVVVCAWICVYVVQPLESCYIYKPLKFGAGWAQAVFCVPVQCGGHILGMISPH